ncbi:MAG: 3-methyl-2-oxobutanoate hydroxymethyltransferase, partial [Gammaproteobacteria bacterium]
MKNTAPHSTPVTTQTLAQQKAKGEKITMLTAYDATLAHWISEAGVDIILVGDSLGMVIQGHTSTIPVSVADVAYHVKAVARGCRGPLILADAPFMSCSNSERALHTAQTLMQAGANMIKIEGSARLCPLVTQLSEEGIPVCGHLGLRPQSINQIGAYRVHGRHNTEAETLMADVEALVKAGIRLLVLECVPASLAARVAAACAVPVIGIGAGVDVDGQVLVLHDMLGLTPKPPRFSRNFLIDVPDIPAALTAFRDAVKSK